MHRLPRSMEWSALIRGARIAALLAVAAAAGSAAAGTLELKCDSRVEDPRRRIVACPRPGVIYDQKMGGGVQDGVVVELRNFPQFGREGGLPSTIWHYWFDENGKFLYGKHGPLVNLTGGPKVIGPGGAFTGRLTLDSGHLKAGHRYMLLIRVHEDCRGVRPGPCKNQVTSVTLPNGLHVTPGKGPSQLTIHSPWSESHFAWAWLEVRPAHERPAPDVVVVKPTPAPPPVGPTPAPKPVPVPQVETHPLNAVIKARQAPAGYDGLFPIAEHQVVAGATLHLQVSVPESVRDARPGPFEILLDGNPLSSAAGWWHSVTLPASLASGPHRLTVRAADEDGKRRYERQLDLQAVAKPRGPQVRIEGPVENDREITVVVTDLPPEVGLWSIEPHSFVQKSEQRDGTTLRFRFTVPIEALWNWQKAALVRSTIDSKLAVTFRQQLGVTHVGYENSFKVAQPITINAACRNEIKPALQLDPGALALKRTGDNALYVRVAGFACGERLHVYALNEAGDKFELAGPLVAGPRGSGPYKPDRADDLAALVFGLEKVLQPRKPEKHVIVARGDSGREARQSIVVTPASWIEVAPARAKTGERIRIRHFGFQANAYAHVFLGEDQLTFGAGKPLEKDQEVEVRLPEAIVGSKVVRLVDREGNQGEAAIEIEGEGTQAGCNAPCLELPKIARQGERFDAYIGGFARNEELLVRFAELFDAGRTYQRDLQVKHPVLIPRNVKDGRYRLTVATVSDPRRTASRELDVQGGYRPPTLAITCPRGQDGCAQPRFKPGESLNTTGTGWSVKARFSGMVASAASRQAISVTQEGCLGGLVDGTDRGRPCDEAAGEINKFWSLPQSLPAGEYALEVSDGMDRARALFMVEAALPPDPAKPKPLPPPPPPPAPVPGPDPVKPAPPAPPAPPVVKQPEPPNVAYCSENQPRYAQPGCVERPEPGMPIPPAPLPAPLPRPDPIGPAPQPPSPARYCNENQPRYTQPGCVERPEPPKKPSIPTKCNPAVPGYAQPGCIP